MSAQSPPRSAPLMQSMKVTTAASGRSGTRLTLSLRRRGVATLADHPDDAEDEDDGAAEDDPHPEHEPGGEHNGAEGEHKRPDRRSRELVDRALALGECGVGAVLGAGRELPRLQHQVPAGEEPEER